MRPIRFRLFKRGTWWWLDVNPGAGGGNASPRAHRSVPTQMPSSKGSVPRRGDPTYVPPACGSVQRDRRRGVIPEGGPGGEEPGDRQDVRQQGGPLRPDLGPGGRGSPAAPAHRHLRGEAALPRWRRTTPSRRSSRPSARCSSSPRRRARSPQGGRRRSPRGSGPATTLASAGLRRPNTCSLLEACQPERRLWIQTAVYTGGRESELLRIDCRRDIDFKRGFVILRTAKGPVRATRAAPGTSR